MLSTSKRWASMKSDGSYYSTRIDLAPEVQVEIIEILNRTLASTIDLWTQVNCAHWNVKGMQFFSLYQLFEQLAEQLNYFATLVGERIVALGGVALGTARTAAQFSEIPDYRLSSREGQGYVLLLAEQMAVYARSVRSSIEIAQGLGEANTADLYTEISRSTDKFLWMLEAHVQT
ncbi:DNA protection during starvation protein [Acaryochloris thomasi RCC1774]|uniref:DNA protection during starvation protein n=1 Tax=Acaryochloris thomasi RCC1774 TaxID=1764569 RepID=A0A2W1JXE8_9CYAN|nr:DNA starvation/stationary phase protection protein Dps [Acaryochloris thomasi]PZD73321.1 DNA protection during starvation protein [Acaryochloris thomasi RCC1774]